MKFYCLHDNVIVGTVLFAFSRVNDVAIPND